MYKQKYEQTPRGPLTQSAIKRDFFTLITKADFDKEFTQQTYIGSGAQGQVYSAIFGGQKVAIKYFRKQSMGPELIHYIQSQIEALEQIRHRNILSLLCTYQVTISNYNKKFCIVTQFCEENLQNYDIIQPLSQIQKIQMCSEIIAGIHAAHMRKVMHRDIKPDNILIKDKETLEIKIADFGCSKMKDDTFTTRQNLGLTTYVGTPLYSDPNIKEGKYSVKCDIYSAGLVIVYIFCKKHFFSHCLTLEQLALAKLEFTRDTVSSVLKFLQQFDDQQVSPMIKTFLTEVATFTMDNQEKYRHSAEELLDYINNQLEIFKALQRQKSQNSNDSQNEFKSYKEPGKNILGNEDMKKKKFKSQFKDSEVEKNPEDDFSSKKYNEHELNSSSYHSLEESNSIKSKETMQTNENSAKLQSVKYYDSYQDSKNDFSYDGNPNKSYSNGELGNPNKSHSNQESGMFEQSFDSPIKQYDQSIDSPNKSQKQQNSFMSSDSYEVENKWNGNQKSQRYQINMFRSLKSSSLILQSRTPKMRSKNTIEEESLRQSRIDQKQRYLTETQKLCSQLTRYVAESSHINEQGELIKSILETFSSIKKNFELIKKIGQINVSPFTKEQKAIISFMFHFHYAGKMKDLRFFVLGQPSNLKLEYLKISAKRRESICELVDKELQRIYENLKNYSNDLKRKVDLIRPRIPDFIRNCIDDAFRCTTPKDYLLINYKETEIKQDTRKFIQDKQATTRNETELEILKDLSKAISRMCQ